jgi:endonuclease/exonuclease/phosphatase family metal-dependent hydrolase
MVGFKVGTWNILGRRVASGEGTASDGAVMAVLAKDPVDILCLQEIHFYDDQPDAQLLSELKAAGLSHFAGQAFSPSHLDEDAQLGVGVASRHPLSGYVSHQLQNPGLTAVVRDQTWVLHDKGIVGVTVEPVGGPPLRVFSLHLFPFFEFNVGDDADEVNKMWNEFFEFLDRQNLTEHAVLAGDFNQKDREGAARSRGKSTWRFYFGGAATTPSGMSLDEIALSWEPTQASQSVVSTFSDHHLVILEVGMSGTGVRSVGRDPARVGVSGKTAAGTRRRSRSYVAAR